MVGRDGDVTLEGTRGHRDEAEDALQRPAGDGRAVHGEEHVPQLRGSAGWVLEREKEK